MIARRPDLAKWLSPILSARAELRWPCVSTDRAVEGGAGRCAAAFHVVLRGYCTLTVGSETTVLSEGDVAIGLQRDDRLAVMSASEAADLQTQIDEFRSSPAAKAAVLCGNLHFEHVDDLIVKSLLPSGLILRARNDPRALNLVQLIRQELEDGRPGGDRLAVELVRLLLIMAMRQRAVGTGALRAPAWGDPRLLRVLEAMRLEPGRSWSLDDLAGVAGASRATLVRIFRRDVGEGPLAYLTALRVSLAQSRIATTDDPLGAIAEDVGYRSEAAFSRAYRRRFGVSPRDHRIAHRHKP